MLTNKQIKQGTLFMKFWAIIIGVGAVITTIFLHCGYPLNPVKPVAVVELGVTASDFPWMFPSPCGLDSVTCDNGDLETDLEAAVAANIICRKEHQQVCSTNGEVHTHSAPVCVEESRKVVEAAVAANSYLLGLTSEEQGVEYRLKSYLSHALGGDPMSYPLSSCMMESFGYQEGPGCR